MLVLACDINTLLILLNCWWIELKIKWCQLGFLPNKVKGKGSSYCAWTFQRHNTVPSEGYLLIEVVGSRNLLAIQNKNVFMWSRLKKSQFFVATILKTAYDCTFSPSAQIDMRYSSSSGSRFPQSRS